VSEQPSSAPTDLTDLDAPAGDARDDADAGAVLRETAAPDTPGGGGLGGDDAGTAQAAGGPAPNSPVDGLASAGDAGAAREAGRLATDPGRR